MKIKKRKTKIISVFELFILVVSIIAFAWMIGAEFKMVNAPTYSFETNEVTGAYSFEANEVTGGVKGLNWWALGEFAASVATSFFKGGVGSWTIELIGGMSGIILGQILEGISYAMMAFLLYKIIFGTFASGRNMQAIFNDYVMWGSVLGSVVLAVIILAAMSELASGPIGWIALIIEIIFMAFWILFSYQEYSQEVFSYKALIWQPIKGGQNCEKCNDLPFGCNEYQCKSFGTACEIVNKGKKQEACINVAAGDITGPEIYPIEEVLNIDYFYEPLTALTSPNKGVKIIYKGEGQTSDGCLPPFSDLTLGVSTNEVAHCKIDTQDKTLSDMVSEMQQEGYYTINHTIFVPSVVNPSQSAINTITVLDDDGNPVVLDAGQDKNFYIRCEDVNGNPSPYSFLMQFCVQQGPDTMAPIIKGTNYFGTENYISFNTQQAYLQVYTNEPADCKWDFQDLTYDEMLYNMSGCSQNLTNFLIPSSLTYGCETNLTGIKNYEDNVYYIRCKDQPWLKGTIDELNRNANKKSYLFTLKGTYDLAIENVSVNSKPNNTIIRDSANQTQVVLRVNTAGGAEEGKSKCQYNLGGNWNFFYNDGSLDFLVENSQKLFLISGNYNYPIRCFDIGGNLAYSSIGFIVEQDVTAPLIIRVYSENNQIKLITDEEAECVYSITGYNYEFADGTSLSTSDSLNHYADWATETDLFIKCKDSFGNKPLYDKCSIVVRGSQF